MPDSVRLPKGYLQVEWIKSSGTQYINTGISGQRYYRLDVQFDPTDNRQLFGIGGSGNEYCGRAVNGTWEKINSPDDITPSQRCIINFDAGTITSQKASKWIEGSATLLEGTAAVNWSTALSNEVLLFTLTSSITNYKWTAKVFRFTAYTTFTNREKIADLIPCVRAYDNKPGLYDIVREQFLTNTGTGEFTYGPYVPYVEETEDIPIQNNFVKKIGGKLFVWNQLVHNGNFSDTTTAGLKNWTDGSSWAVTSADISNGIVSHIPTRSYGGIKHLCYDNNGNGIKSIEGHKYFFGCRVKCTDYTSSSPDIFIVLNNGKTQGGITVPKNSNWQNLYDVYTYPVGYGDGTELWIQVQDSNTSNWKEMQITNFMVFDLTLMFGYGNEPTTADKFIAMFPEPYYAYSQGVEKAKITGSIVARGKNLFDISNIGNYVALNHSFRYLNEKNELVTGNSTGDSSAGYWNRALDYLCPGLKVGDTVTFNAVKDPERSGGNWIYFAGDGSIMSFGQSKKITKEELYGNVYFYANGSSTVIETVKIKEIQMEKGTTSTAYQVYLDPIETIIPNSITSLYGYGWGINGVENYVDFETQTYHQKIGAVDMGSLGWSKTTATIDGASQIVFYANVPGRKLDNSKNIIFCKYASTNGSIANLHNDKSICGYYYLENSRIALRDSSFNGSTPAEFKSSLNGAYLYYELAEEIVTPISGFVLPENYEGGSYELVDYFNPEDYTKNNLPITFEMSQGIIPLPSEKAIKIKPKSNEKFKMALPLHRFDYGLTIQVLNKTFPEGTFCSWETKSRTFLTYSYYGGCFDIPDAVLDANYEGDVIGHVCVPGLEGFRDSFDIFLPMRDMKLPEFGLVDYAINGDFTEPLDTTMYAANQCSIEKEVLCLKATCTTVTSDNNFELHYYTAKAAGGIGNIKGHKFIGVCDIMANRTNGLTSRVNFYNGVQGGYGINYFTCIANKWVRHYTTVATVPDNATSWNFYEHYEITGSSSLQVGDWFRMKNLRVIDLTATYGYGNEPNSYEALIQDLNKRGISLTDDRVIKNFNQLIQNGDYTRPLDVSHYSRNRVDISIVDKALKCEANSTSYPFGQIHYKVFTVMSEVEKRINHKIITVYDLLTKLSNIQSRAYVYTGVNALGGNLFNPLPNVWTRHYTQVVTLPANSTSVTVYEQFTNDNIQLGDWFKIRNWMAFDLTEMYGTGSEPESYFQLVADLKSIGVDIENNYYELI